MTVCSCWDFAGEDWGSVEDCLGLFGTVWGCWVLFGAVSRCDDGGV